MSAIPSAEIVPEGGAVGTWDVDLRRLSQLLPIAIVILLTGSELYRLIAHSEYGIDFAGMWKAAHALLAGHAIYPSPSDPALRVSGSAFLSPPPLLLPVLPLVMLPYTAAAVLWNCLCAGMLGAALALVGVRDWRVYLVAMCSLPFADSLGYGQTEAVLALGLAVAWRWRDSWPSGVAVGLVIACKPIAWPLLVWLLLTRRIRCSLVAVGAGTASLALTWACIGFKGLVSYPQLLSADARAAKYFYSPAAGLQHLGVSTTLATVLGVVFSVAVVLAVLAVAENRDLGLFTAGLIGGLLSSPLLEVHYLVLLLIPLAISRPRLDRAWLVVAGLWLLVIHEHIPSDPGQVVFVVFMASAAAMLGSSKFWRHASFSSP